MYIINWLKRPDFFYSDIKHKLIICLIISSSVFLFLYIFQPFGISILTKDIFFYTGGFGLITFFLCFSFSVFLPLLLKKSFKNWTVGKNILFLLFIIITISIVNWFYNSLVQGINGIKLKSLPCFFFNTFTVSVFPVILFTFLKERLFRKKREKISKEIMKMKTSTEVKRNENEIIIYGDNDKENITFSIKDIVYVTSQGNYASFFIYTNKTLEERVLRTTLTSVASNLSEYSSIVRCHKSYIVNSKFMDSISGNARGYFLESNSIKIHIPVSRGLKKEQLKQLIH
jgi:hypothetical protein